MKSLKNLIETAREAQNNLMENLSEEQKKVLAKILSYVCDSMDKQEGDTFNVEISFALTWDEAATVSSIFANFQKSTSMKIRGFEIKHTKSRTFHECELFLPHVSKDTPLKRFRVQNFRELTAGLREIAETHDLQKLCLKDFTDKTELAESLYKAVNQLVSNDSLYKTKI